MGVFEILFEVKGVQIQTLINKQSLLKNNSIFFSKMNKSDHISPFPVEWCNTIQRLEPVYLSGQSSCSSKHSPSKIKSFHRFQFNQVFCLSGSHYKLVILASLFQKVWHKASNAEN